MLKQRGHQDCRITLIKSSGRNAAPPKNPRWSVDGLVTNKLLRTIDGYKLGKAETFGDASEFVPHDLDGIDQSLVLGAKVTHELLRHVKTSSRLKCRSIRLTSDSVSSASRPRKMISLEGSDGPRAILRAP